MDFSDAVSSLALVFSVAIAVIGWSKAAQKDRDHHLFERRLEKRIGMLGEVIEATVPLLNHSNPFESDPKLLEKLSKAHLSIQLYGYQDEIADYKALVLGIEAADVKIVNSALATLVPRIRTQLRKELGYSSVDIDVSRLPEAG